METLFYCLPLLAIMIGAWSADHASARRNARLIAHSRAIRVDARYRRMMRARVARQGR